MHRSEGEDEPRRRGSGRRDGAVDLLCIERLQHGQQWLNDQAPDRFAKSLRDMAQDLDLAGDLIDYRRQREALRDWSLDLDTWHEIITSLPPVPGPVRPNLDDRKRQEASAFVWARVTGGEPLFAPRPIEADQTDDVRRAWFLRRASTWFQLGRPDPLGHYAALRDHLNQHADQIAKRIEASHSIARTERPAHLGSKREQAPG
ncbi:hypothetical protein ACFU76_16060 [Streptomyces sp. NPDC057539]|uniref:hypothetical protein n=1 Tax=Streptomyces sp. NPDC057539 TaxID=3346159 RepID=UPI00368EB4FF